MDGKAMGEALAYAMGDYRDEPARCMARVCQSEDLWLLPDRGVLECRKCGQQMTQEIVMQDRHDRMRKRVLGR